MAPVAYDLKARHSKRLDLAPSILAQKRRLLSGGFESPTLDSGRKTAKNLHHIQCVMRGVSKCLSHCSLRHLPIHFDIHFDRLSVFIGTYLR